MRSCPGRPRLARAVGVSTILLMLWVLVLAPVTASGSATGGAGDAGTPATIPGLAPRGNPNAAVAVSVILSQAPALATPAPAGANPKAARADAGAVVAQQGAFARRATSPVPKAG